MTENTDQTDDQEELFEEQTENENEDEEDEQSQDLGHRLLEIESRSTQVANREAGIVTEVDEEDDHVTIRFERANEESYEDEFEIPGYCPPENETDLHEIENDLLKFCRSDETPYTFEDFIGDGIEDQPIPIEETVHDDYNIWVPDPEEPKPPAKERLINGVKTALNQLSPHQAAVIGIGIVIGMLGLLSISLALTTVIPYV